MPSLSSSSSLPSSSFSFSRLSFRSSIRAAHDSPSRRRCISLTRTSCCSSSTFLLLSLLVALIPGLLLHTSASPDDAAPGAAPAGVGNAGAGASGSQVNREATRARAAVPMRTMEELLAHKYVFVIGAHHSGTSVLNRLLQEHGAIAGLVNTSVPEDEGQHLQSLYSPAKRMGGLLMFAEHSQAHLTESSPLLTEANRVGLYSAWARYWDTSKPMLLEKSPRHTVMTRFLQHAFTPERAYFVAVMRHPLGAYYWHWGEHPAVVAVDCGRRYILHWLKIYDTLLEDAPLLQHLHVVKTERLLSSPNPQAYVDAIFSFLALKDSIAVRVTCDHLKTKYPKASYLRKKMRRAEVQLRHIQQMGPPSKLQLEYLRRNGKIVNNPLCVNNSHADSTASPREAPNPANANANAPDALAATSESLSHVSAPASQAVPPAPVSEQATHAARRRRRRRYRQQQKQVSELESRIADAMGLAIDGTGQTSSTSGTVGSSSAAAGGSATARRLLFYHGLTDYIELGVNEHMQWTKTWSSYIEVNSTSCRNLIAEVEPRLNAYGYSMLDLAHKDLPTNRLAEFMVGFV